ncbi:MAG: hypothetical protein KG003_02295 [Bacteroidetes bacterium]|nr:hypothetical protein [Bacteroidota bacterium]
MWLLPFKTYYLRSTLTRKEIEQRILQITFLSDQGYRKTDNSKKYFYGTNSDELFSLQTIIENVDLVPYADGEIKGVDDDTYIYLDLKAFKHQRIFLVLILFALGGLIFLSSQILEYKTAVFSNLPFTIAWIMILGIGGYIGFACNRFWKLVYPSLNFFEVLLDAETIKYSEIPIVFRIR